MGLALILGCVWLSSVALAGSPGVEDVPETTPRATFTTTEGTWMNVDVHPSGEQVVFDLLGHIYVVPMAGGRAERLTAGHGWNMHPRFSPTGDRIAFTSDRAGGDNLWVMAADGSDQTAITDASFRLLSQPDWTPDGRWVYGRRHYTGQRSLGTGEIWAYSADGEGAGLAWTQRGHIQADVNEPHVDPAGDWLYTVEAGPFDYNRNVYQGIYAIRRTSLVTGESEWVARGAGGAIRPAVSPDGQTLGYLRRRLDGQRTEWVLRDLVSGRERVVFDNLDRDQQETWSIHGTSPAWSWLPDGTGAVFSSEGQLIRVSLDGDVQSIPFEAEVDRPVVEPLRQAHEASPTRFESRAVRWPSVSPDGSALLFQAVGRVWLRPDGGEPVALTDASRLAYAPAWRPDGGAVVFTTWSDQDGGMVWMMRIRRGRPAGKPVALGDGPDLYTNPSFSADGRRVVWARGHGLTNRGVSGAREPSLRIQWRDIDGSIHEAGTVANTGAGVRAPRPQFSPQGDRILVNDAAADGMQLVSMNLDGLDRRIVARGPYVAEFAPSPDGRYIAWKAQHRVYVSPWPPSAGAPLELDTSAAGGKTVRLSAELGEWVGWSGPSTLHYSAGSTTWSVDVSEGLPTRDEASSDEDVSEDGASEEDPWADHTLAALGKPREAGLVVERPQHDGVLALVGAKVVPMVGDTVWSQGTVLIQGERIVAVGPQDEVEVPAGAHVVDVTGKVITPGFVDVHAHMGYGWADISPEVIPAYAANLAYGVTTTHDPSADTHFVFSQRELMEAGRIVGPRIFSTGFILYGAENEDKAVVESLDDAREHLRRIGRYGSFSVKSYNQPRRDQRQWIVAAARESDMLVVPEGGSTLAHNLTMIVDGHTGIEHALPVEQLRDDVVRLWSANPGVHYTPTLLVGYGGVWGEHAFYARHNVWEMPRLQRFTPPGRLESRGKRRPLLVPEEDWHHVRLAETAWRLYQAGVPVNVGAHGQLQGLGVHWEIWALGEGGFTPMEALRAGTFHGAAYLGLDADLGSLEQGKLADLVVMDADPLERLENTDSISLVVRGGVVYNPDDLSTSWPEVRPALSLPWHGGEASGFTLPWHGGEGEGCAHD